MPSIRAGMRPFHLVRFYYGTHGNLRRKRRAARKSKPENRRPGAGESGSMDVRSVCVFCGSRVGFAPAYRDAADRLGRLLGERGITLVYGGGRVGLMGVVADRKSPRLNSSH